MVGLTSVTHFFGSWYNLGSDPLLARLIRLGFDPIDSNFIAQSIANNATIDRALYRFSTIANQIRATLATIEYAESHYQSVCSRDQPFATLLGPSDPNERGLVGPSKLSQVAFSSGPTGSTPDECSPSPPPDGLRSTHATCDLTVSVDYQDKVMIMHDELEDDDRSGYEAPAELSAVVPTEMEDVTEGVEATDLAVKVTRNELSPFMLTELQAD